MLTYDPPEKSIMENPPRNPKDKILTNDTMKGIAFSGIIMGIIAYGAFLFSYLNNQNMPHQYEKAITITFISVIFGQFANLLSRRTYDIAIGKYLFSNINLLLAILFSVSCIILIVYVPVFNLYFHTSPLTVADWILPIGTGIICLIIYEVKKFLNLKKRLKNIK